MLARLFYGPLNPHAGQLYSLPNSRHFSHRQMVTAPQAGQENFMPFSPGVILFPHEIHVGISLSPLSTLQPVI